MRTCTIFVLLAITSLLGCGVPGTPMPPSLEIPKAVGDLKAVRKGDAVTLTWTMPSETTDGELIRKPGKMLVKRAVGAGHNAELNFETISDQPLTPALKEERKAQATASDSLRDLLQAGGTPNFAVYTVVAQGHNGRAYGTPNRVSVPLVLTLPAPQQVKAEPVPEGVKISWDQASLPSSRLSSRYFYRVMRRQEGSTDPVTVTQLDAGSGAGVFVDSGIGWEKSYEYWLRPVTLWQADDKRQDDARKGEVEGDDSAIVKVLAHDSFPPATPTNIQAVYSPGPPHSFIDLTWTPNTESDLAGYNIYRHAENQPLAKINAEVVRTPRFADPAIQPGAKYFYSVSAVDLRGNESSKSEETSEMVPRQ